jgi:hypothetical protein
MVEETRICFEGKSIVLRTRKNERSRQKLTRLPQLRPPQGPNVSTSKISDIIHNCQMIGKIYNRKVNTPVGEGCGRKGMGVVPGIADNLISVNILLS